MKKHIYYFRDKTYICVKKFFILKNLRILKKNTKLNNKLRQHILLKSFKINQKFNLSKLKQYCLFTGRLRFIIKNQKVSRMMFRELCSQGYISGIFKV